ncbi:ABC transporter permease [Pseudoalteromonas haloplanktis]|uniref:ABC transporter permease n=1 Tax=Pseudoalteromonas haloplanktis TaxID=228 RepID=A0ABU1BCV5_PSEHA|nr:ABC transporter permease [Pseudoalteromonas haloplanktis]MDQ9092150.1 ABC transporter permease [Pseudoalteromonas haloplanktis]
MSRLTKTRSQLRLAWASLMNAPGFVAAVVATLALTLATLFVVLSLVNSYFLKPLDVFDESRMVVVEQQTTYQENSSSGFQSYQSIVHWLKNNQSFEQTFMINAAEQVFSNLDGQPKEDVLYVGAEYFELLNTPFLLGQGFNKGKTLEEIDDSVIISENFWQEHFDSDPNVIGKTLKTVGGIGNSGYTITGVVAGHFSPPYMIKAGSVEAWFPTSSDRRFFHTDDWQSPWTNTFGNLKLIAVLKPGVTNEQVKTDLKAQIDSIKSEWLDNGGITDINPVVTPYREVELGNNDQLSLMMLAGALGLLVIAVLNVSTLFFSRALAQHKTLALQAVLGAKRKTLFNSILLQSLILMSISVSIALFLSVWGIRLFKVLAEGRLPLVNSIAVDTNLVLVAIVMCIALAYIFSIITAYLINYKTLNQQMQNSGKGGISQVSGRTVRLLIGVQMFVAALLVSFSVMVVSKSLETINRPLGSDTENLFFAQLFQPNNNSSLDERYVNAKKYQKILQDSEGIKGVALGHSPITARQTANSLTDVEGNSTIFFPSQGVGVEYFDLVNTKILAGRTFSEQAVRGETNEMLVSLSVAKWLLPNQDHTNIIGQSYRGLQDKMYEIIGITEDFNHPKYYDESFGRHIWWPAQPWSYMFIIEAEPGVKLTGKQVLNILSGASTNLTLWQFKDSQQEYDNLLYMSRLTVVLCCTLALFTLLLAAIGIFGVLSYNLGLRRYEFGIRMALGAKKARLFKLMSKEAVLPVLIGFILALSVMIAGYHSLQEQLVSWLILDVRLQLLAWFITLIIAMFACFRPLLLLIKAKPMAALRNE